MATLDAPVHPEGGIAILKGSLAPEGSVVKQTVVSKEMRKHTGKAKVYNSEEEALAGIVGGEVVAGNVVIIRYEGPKGGPGMRRPFADLGDPRDLVWNSVALITDGRFSKRYEGSPHRPRLPRGGQAGNSTLS